jgi:hypothetical protein
VDEKWLNGFRGVMVPQNSPGSIMKLVDFIITLTDNIFTQLPSALVAKPKQ